MSLPRRLSGLSNMLTEFDQGKKWVCLTAGWLLTAIAAGRDVRSASWEAATSSITNDPGHLYLGAQTKSTYVSPTFFATLGREVGDMPSRETAKGLSLISLVDPRSQSPPPVPWGIYCPLASRSKRLCDR